MSEEGAASSGSMLDELRQYYHDQDISAEVFRCKHHKECSEGCESEKFIFPVEAFVGSEYEKHTLPRLLFVSLDPADDYHRQNGRTPTLGGVRESLEGTRPTTPHWKQTHHLAHEILGPMANARLGLSLSYEMMSPYFAHTNSAKCKNPAMGANQGRPILFENCREFIPGELEILRPDILVAQGKSAWAAVADFPTESETAMGGDANYSYKIIRITGRKVIKFETIHPSARGRHFRRVRDEKEKAWGWYAEAARKFVEQSATPNKQWEGMR